MTTDLEELVLRAWRPVWARKRLWFLGILAGTGGGVGFNPGGHRGGAGEPLPSWVLPVVVGASVLGLVMLVLHVLGEAALIRAIAQPEEPFRVRRSLAEARPFFWRVLGVKAVMFLAFVPGFALVAAPLLLALIPKILPIPLGIGLTVLLLLVAIPFALTLFFLVQYALRIAVLEGLSVRASLAAAHAYLHGRIASSLVLLIIQGASGPVAGLAGLVGALPAAIVGGLVWLAFGLVPGLVTFGLLVLPVALALGGALGAFQSALWTTAFLDGRAADRA